MTKRFYLIWHHMANHGAMTEDWFLGFDGDTTDRRKYAPSYIGYKGSQLPTFTAEEVAEQKRLLANGAHDGFFQEIPA